MKLRLLAISVLWAVLLALVGGRAHAPAARASLGPELRAAHDSIAVQVGDTDSDDDACDLDADDDDAVTPHLTRLPDRLPLSGSVAALITAAAPAAEIDPLFRPPRA